MNTNSLKSFARQARIQLMEEVSRQLHYWGFAPNSDTVDQPKFAPGGYTLREEVSDDTSVLDKWKRLQAKIQGSEEGFEDVVEEAAYTWFNRLMALKILEENHFIDPVLAFEKDTRVPAILQNAKAGIHSIRQTTARNNLIQALQQDEDDKALGILLINYCNEHSLLQKVFGRINDYTEILVPQNLLSSGGFLENLNSDTYIAPEDYRHVELIGWLYQFYISDRKDEVFNGFSNNIKARAEDIPAATQIFTPRWIVDYMVENTIGKIYLDYEEDSLLKNGMKYLVTSDEDETTKPSKGLIADITELTLIDPACGSGHIVVRGFEWMYKMYKEQGYNPQQAVQFILQKNLFGLDIDNRAMQLSRFSVLLKAAQKLREDLPGKGKELVNNPGDLIPHIYSFPESRNIASSEIVQFTQNQYVAEISKAFIELQKGKNLGSALQLQLSDEAITTLKEQYRNWKAKAQNAALTIDEAAIWGKVKEYAEIALILSQQYTAVVANPPYMGQKNMNAGLKNYVNKQYPLTKSDLFAVFMEVGLNLTLKQGLMGMINQHSWMFLSSYEKYRNEVLLNYSLQNMVHLGSRTFEELSGEVVQSTAFVIQKSKPQNARANYYRLIDYRNNKEKEENFLAGNNFYSNIPQSNFEKIPGSPIAYWVSENIVNIIKKNKPLGEYSEPRAGLQTSDNKRFLRNWSEVEFNQIGIDLFRTEALKSEFKWFPHNKGGGNCKWYGNNEIIINFKNDGEELKHWLVNNPNDPTTRHWSRNLRNYEHYFKEGLTWGSVSSRGITCRYSNRGKLFDTSGPMILADEEDLKYLLGFINTSVFDKFLNIFSQTLSKGSGEFSKVPLILSKRIEIDNFVKTNISLSKKDWDSRETSWDFEENPLIKQQTSSLKEAYQAWKEDISQDFFQLHENEEELNRIFIDIYGLQEELSPDVALKDVTILQDEIKNKDLEDLEEAFRKEGKIDLPIQKDVVIQQFLSYLIGLMMGRYRLDKPGLHIAHPNPTESEIAPYAVNHVAEPFNFRIEEDAVLPMIGEDSAFANDAAHRIKDIVYHTWGDDTHSQNLNFIEDCLGMSIEKWISEKFWPYHFSGTMYKNKPIYWLFASNPEKPHRSAFKVLVYMHRMDAYTVQKIMRNYLYLQQEYLTQKAKELLDREAMLSQQEIKQAENMTAQLNEMKEYEQKLKTYANQQITFDLDDGVTENLKLFEGIVAELK